MAGESAFLSQMLRQQAAAEGRGQMVKDAIAGQAASQIMRQIAMGEVQREMAREAQTGRALESAAGRQAQRDVGKARMETQKELEEKQRLLGLIGGAAEATGALGGYLVSQNALEEAQFKGRVEKAALNPEVDDMSQFNPEDLEALRAMSQEQTEADAAAMVFDEGAVDIRGVEGALEMERLQETAIADAERPRGLDGYSGYDFNPDSVKGTFPMNPDKLLSTDDSFPRDPGAYELEAIRGMVDPERAAKRKKEREAQILMEQLKGLRGVRSSLGSAPVNPYSD
jgi:hypothetical protein